MITLVLTLLAVLTLPLNLNLNLNLNLLDPSASSAFLASPGSGVGALHFYFEGGVHQKCFLEELPKDTTVIGTFTAEKNVKANDYEPDQYAEDPNTSIDLVVKHIDTNHELVNQKGKSKGRFTFTASDHGQHQLCFTCQQGGWFSSQKTKLTLDLLFGDISHDVFSGKTEAVKDVATRVKDLTERAHAIVREQRYQKTLEAKFRDTSEATNTKVVHWTIIQVVVLVITGLWQIRHLRQFFVTKKLV